MEHILNPRFSSHDLLSKFVNMDRVLENVTTYYFENFLNLAERSIISSELLAVENNVSTEESDLNRGLMLRFPISLTQQCTSALRGSSQSSPGA